MRTEALTSLGVLARAARQAVRDVLVVCSRWYGGAPLGPARFRHIASTAKDALRRGGFVEEPADQKGKADKGRRKKGGK